MDAVEKLYQERSYPPMSHPVADPAVSWVAARMAGLRVRRPAESAILEIGCGSGHHLIPLALRWPRASFTGIDISDEAIATARRRAVRSGAKNIRFIAGDIRDMKDSGWRFDHIIAHGFFSWVPDEVKAALLSFCAGHLTETGAALISFNVQAGWRERYPVVDAARKIQQQDGLDESKALRRLQHAIDDPHVRWIIDDMLAKGPEILRFDDFGPVNDAWPLDHFVGVCARSGLRWLGESDPGANGIPPSLDDAGREALRPIAGDPLQVRMAIDEMTRATFRAPVFCRHDAPLERVSTALVMDLCVHSPAQGAAAADAALNRFQHELGLSAPHCVPVREILERMGSCDVLGLLRSILQAIQDGGMKARVEPVIYDPSTPPRPALNPFRLLCAKERLPLVDAWHVPCGFPSHHYPLLELVDGTRSSAELAALSSAICPDLDFHPWLRHLAGRGMFST